MSYFCLFVFFWCYVHCFLWFSQAGQHYLLYVLFFFLFFCVFDGRCVFFDRLRRQATISCYTSGFLKPFVFCVHRALVFLIGFAGRPPSVCICVRVLFVGFLCFLCYAHVSVSRFRRLGTISCYICVFCLFVACFRCYVHRLVAWCRTQASICADINI